MWVSAPARPSSSGIDPVGRGICLMILAGFPATTWSSGTLYIWVSHWDYTTRVWFSYLGDNASCSDYNTIAKCDPRQDYHLPTQPTIFPNMNFLSVLWTLITVSQYRVKRMWSRVEWYVRAHKGARTNSDHTGIYKGAIEVEEDLPAKLDILAIIHPYRRYDPWIVPELSYICIRVFELWRQWRLVVLNP